MFDELDHNGTIGNVLALQHGIYKSRLQSRNLLIYSPAKNLTNRSKIHKTNFKGTILSFLTEFYQSP